MLVCNKSKPDALKDKILFINADREYAEGKSQNRLRPEDIEKIDFVFTHRRELSKYSRLVPKSEIVDTHDYNLNIRRYVDNTPDPEPEDVQAHLIGGIPRGGSHRAYRRLRQVRCEPGLTLRARASCVPRLSRVHRRQARYQGQARSGSALLGALTQHRDTLESGWAVAKDDFAQLQHADNGGKKMPEVRSELLTTLKDKLEPLGVLDEFKSAGVFVNWWQQIRYDLKTIVSTGWHHTLIPDEYLIAEYFRAEADAIEVLEATIAEAQGELTEAVETAQEVSSYEPEEDKKVTAAVIKKALKALIDDLKGNTGASARKELNILTDQDKIIKAIEKRIKNAKATLKDKAAELEFKLELKRIGADDFRAETQVLIAQADSPSCGAGPEEEGRQEDHHCAPQGQGSAERPPCPGLMRFSRRSAVRSARPMPAG